MFQRLTALTLVTLMAGSLSGCGSSQGVGTVLGGIGGGLAGSTIGKGRGKTLATIAGALGGALLGGMIGKDLDSRDKAMAENAATDALATGQPMAWTNPQTGHRGEVVPSANASYNRFGQPCRDFTHTAYIDNRPVVVHGRACRDADGTWRVVQQ